MSRYPPEIAALYLSLPISLYLLISLYFYISTYSSLFLTLLLIHSLWLTRRRGSSTVPWSQHRPVSRRCAHTPRRNPWALGCRPASRLRTSPTSQPLRAIGKKVIDICNSCEESIFLNICSFLLLRSSVRVRQIKIGLHHWLSPYIVKATGSHSWPTPPGRLNCDRVPTGLCGTRCWLFARPVGRVAPGWGRSGAYMPPSSREEARARRNRFSFCFWVQEENCTYSINISTRVSM